MDENEIKEIIKRIGLEEIIRRLQTVEAAIFTEPAGDLPEERHVEKKPRRRKSLKPEKVQGYISQNNISKTELVLLAKQLGIKVSSILSKSELIDIILGGEHTQEDPLKEIRDRTEMFITENNIAISTMKCDLKCQECPEARVVLCHQTNSKTVEQYFDQ